MDRIVYYNRQPSIAIETGTDGNELTELNIARQVLLEQRMDLLSIKK